MSTAFTNGEVRPISVQGSGVRGTYAPQKDNRAVITAININNPNSSFSVSLYRGKTLIYSVNLNAGDNVNDSTGYVLIEGDTLIISSAVSVNYSIEGFEYQKSCINPPSAGRGNLQIINSDGNFKGIGPQGPQGPVGPAGPGGTLTNLTATNNTGQTWTITDPASTPNISLSLTKSAVGLSNVDNTSDANKPVSTATQTALNLKYDASNPNSYISGITGINAGGELSGTYPNPAVLNSAILAKVLTGLNISGSSISATDTIIQAFGKLQSQMNGVLGGAIYQGVWNATTNSPTLADGVGVKGNYYVVSVAGNIDLGSGVIDFKVGDWAIYNGAIWQKVDNTDAVSSVNGQIGAVNLTTADVPEVTNLYFTTSRVLATALTGYVSGAGVISATDTILQAIQKLNGNIASIGITTISGTAIFDFGNETDKVAATISNASLTNANIKSALFIPVETSETSLDDFALNLVRCDIQNIVDNTSFDIAAIAANNASGNYSVNYKINY